MIHGILTNTCPNCKKGKIYEETNIYFNFRKPKMKKGCDTCNFTFDKEPGFFYGAMYVSYALGIIEALLTFLVAYFFFDIGLDLKLLGIISLVLLVMSSFNLRVSRIIWIYLLRGI
ncbi:DUF983 domain-containing protein [Seonamhaeicola marinus]|uniref:DUF983 domain-containing protein n=1 Tax=Seonamhaeicola marinus TaxID=1912246 RepID=A0A5D0HG81_9FLAO|nr:DUF983 domain-containing protein [Seonamhaeicola marinus]TYA69940.1 DUF983 domain-containing protein [Seonamhaeicola marinus]